MRLRVDVFKLRVAIDVLAAFSRLAVGLQAVAHVAQKLADDRRTNLVPLLRQLLHKIAQAAGRPQQRPHRIAPRRRLDQALQIGFSSVGSCSVLRLRPAPGLRTRPSGAHRPERMSSIPRLIVERARPLIRDIALTPP